MPFISGTKMRSMTDLIEKQSQTINELKSKVEELNQPITVAKKVEIDNSFESKFKNVKEHLIRNGNITSWEAIQSYNATRLSAIIFQLKKQGMNITTTPETSGKSRFVRYHYSAESVLKA